MRDRNLVPVEGKSSLFRDPSSGAIINTNESAAKASLSARQRVKAQEQDIKDLKSDMNEIKDLLTTLLKERLQ